MIDGLAGGGEMGRAWYEKQGKYLQKKNTFNDFCDVAEHLIATGWTKPARLAQPPGRARPR